MLRLGGLHSAIMMRDGAVVDIQAPVAAAVCPRVINWTRIRSFAEPVTFSPIVADATNATQE